jgi:hypothetical protein
MRIHVLSAVTVAFLAACGGDPQPAGGADATAAQAPGASAEAVAPAAPAVSVRNAYLSNTMDADGVPGTPVTRLATDEKAYVGVVLLGDAPETPVEVIWALDGAEAGRATTRVASNGSAVAAVDLTADAPLQPGHYTAMVTVDGKPSWELEFDVR